MKACAAAFGPALVALATPAAGVALGACRTSAPSRSRTHGPISSQRPASRAERVRRSPGAQRRPALRSDEKVTGEGQAMGTHLAYAAFTTPALDAARVSAPLFDAATAEIVRLEKLMTTWDPTARSRGSTPPPARSRSPSARRPSTSSARRCTPARSARAASTSPSRRCTASGSSTRTSIPTRRRRPTCERRLKYVGYRHVKLDAAAQHRLPRRAARAHRARRHRQGLRRRPARPRCCSTAGLTSPSTCRRAAISSRAGRSPTARPGSAGIRDPARPGGRLLRDDAGERPRLQHGGRLRARLRRGRQALPPHHRPPHRATRRPRRAA